MDKLTLTTVHKQRIALIAFAVATLMLVDCIYQVAMHIRWQVWIPSTLVMDEPTTQTADEESSDKQQADVEGKSSETQAGDTEASAEKPSDTEASAEKPSDAEASGEETKSNGDKPGPSQKAKKISALLEAAITKRNIMAKPKPKKVELIGVLGKIALLKIPGGKTVGIEEGKSAQGIKVISIEGYKVTIEHHGQTETKQLFPDKDKPLAPGAASAPESDAAGKDKVGSEKAKPKTGPPKASGEKVGQSSSLPSDPPPAGPEAKDPDHTVGEGSSLPSDREETSSRNKGAN